MLPTAIQPSSSSASVRCSTRTSCPNTSPSTGDTSRKRKWTRCLKLSIVSATSNSSELVKFIDGQPCDIKPGTIGREQAEIAKKLVAQNPALALTENRDTLLAQIDDIYKLVHPSVVVKLDESELDALARRLQTLEELPRLALEVKRNPMNLLDKIIDPED